jgi:aldose 1-epimerase
MAIDRCHTGWDGAAYIEWCDQPPDLEILASEQLPNAVVCIRNDVDGSCFEPVAHVNDAVNRREADCAMPVVAPGKDFSASIRFRAVPREAV